MQARGGHAIHAEGRDIYVGALTRPASCVVLQGKEVDVDPMLLRGERRNAVGVGKVSGKNWKEVKQPARAMKRADLKKPSLEVRSGAPWCTMNEAAASVEQRERVGSVVVGLYCMQASVVASRRFGALCVSRKCVRRGSSGKWRGSSGRQQRHAGLRSSSEHVYASLHVPDRIAGGLCCIPPTHVM